MNTVQCPHCNNSVSYDESREKQFCSSCGDVLYRNVSHDAPEQESMNQPQASMGCLSALGAMSALLACLVGLIAIAFIPFPASEPYYDFSIKLGVSGMIVYGIGYIVDAMK